MELRQLRYFVKVAETLSFSEAAKALSITQSTLSQQIKQLEQELHAQLFQRNSRGVGLTEAGEELLPNAKRTIYDSEVCIDRIHDLQELLSGTLNIGITYTFSPILTETLLTFMKLYPKVKLNIYYKPMDELMDMLEHRDVDFVLAFKPIVHFEDIESHLLFDNYLAAIVNKYHPLAKKKSVTLAELEKYDMALPTKGLQARNAFEHVRSNYSTNFHIRAELNEVNILLQLIKGSNMVTILSEATIHNQQDVKAVRLDVPDNSIAGCVHTLKNVYRKRSMLVFLKHLSESKAIRERLHDWL